MNPSEFTIQAPGRLVQSLEGRWAYVPNPLPPDIDFNLEVLASLSEADRSLGELAGAGHALPNPHLLIGPFLRREAVFSSRIEGTAATSEELVLFEIAPDEPAKNPDVREVSNYVRALNYGLARLAEFPVSLRLIREVHSILMEGVRGEDKHPGEFRSRQNYIASPGQPVEDARFVPPPPAEMNEALNDFEKYLHQPRHLPPLIDLALIHYQFEGIHPFMDGNGRIGRLLISLLLCARGHLPLPLLYLSAFFEQHRLEYYNHLLRVSQNGEWTAWIKFFLRGVATQSRDAILRSTRLLVLRESYRRRLQQARTSGLVLQLVDSLFKSPALTIRQAQEYLQVKTFNTAQSAVEGLVRTGILAEHTGKRRNRIYIAPEIIRITEGEES